jgi:tetratricopeptide (TPR) repeat protein
MGFFQFFQKSPEDIEQAGDRCFNAGDYGSAKIAYDRALARAEKNAPEKTALIRRLEDKCRRSKEALARFHLETVRDLMSTGEHDAEASELVILALELTEDERLKQDLMQVYRDIQSRGTSVRDPGGAGDEGTDSIDSFMAPDQDHDEDEDGYFSILCSTLPDEIQDVYHGFGQEFRKGYVALNRGDFKTAVALLTNAMEGDADPHGLIPPELATALVNLGRYETARRIMEPFVLRYPESVRAYQILCDIYWEQKEYELAAALLATCPASLQSSIQIRLLLGETLYLKEDYHAAIRLFSTWLDHHGYNEIMARSLAKALEAAGETQKARDLYARIINGCATCGSRTDPFIRRRYAELCYQTGDRSKKLLDLYLNLSQEDPDNKREYYLRIQQLYEKLGDNREARRFQAMAETAESKGG